MLKLTNVSKRFKSNIAVDNISFEVPSGKMLGFLGRNGAGKTTTFRMVLGLTEPTTGEILYKGKTIDSSIYDNIGYLPEERGLHPKLRVEQELSYMAGLKNMKKKSINAEIDYWLKTFNIEENRKKKIEELSKGNQQKIQLIASIIHRPKLLILDEPFSGLDPVNVELLKKAIINLNTQGTSIIFSTHRMDHVEELCDNICIMKNGGIVLSGPLSDIKNNYGFKEVFINTPEDISHLENIEGVLKRSSLKNGDIFKVTNDKVANALFEETKKLNYLKKFEILEPSLNDIFIDKVGEINE